MEKKKYFAFISYKREDEEWAKWFQNELENYHLPAVYNGRDDLPQNLRPVFCSYDELIAGDLPSQLQQALTESLNLIVICSPQAAVSPWVNREVESFIAQGKADRIFPFIVEGNTPQEFLPPVLMNIPEIEQRVEVNVKKHGRDKAFIKIVTEMLDVSFDSLWDGYEREKVRHVKQFESTSRISNESFPKELKTETHNQLQTLKYDVFLSSKSEDYPYAEEVYNFLKENGLNVFAASKELDKIGEAAYAVAIDAALDATEHMVVIASSIENIKSKWVDYEWRTFRNDLNSGYREGNLLTILSNITPKELPAGLRHQQSFNYNSFKDGRILGFLKTTGSRHREHEKDALQDANQMIKRNLIVFAAEKAKILYKESLSIRERLEEMNSEKIISGYQNETETEEAFRLVRLFVNNSKELSNEKVVYAVFSPNKQKIASIIRLGQIHVWDVTTENLMVVLRMPGWTFHLAINNQGSLIAVTSGSNQICVWETATMMLKGIIDNEGHDVLFTSFTSDDKLLVAVSSDDTISAWDINGWKKLKIS